MYSQIVSCPRCKTEINQDQNYPGYLICRRCNKVIYHQQNDPTTALMDEQPLDLSMKASRIAIFYQSFSESLSPQPGTSSGGQGGGWPRLPNSPTSSFSSSLEDLSMKPLAKVTPSPHRVLPLARLTRVGKLDGRFGHYPCPECPRIFKMKSNLVQHMHVHRGNKRFKCEICGEGFFYKMALKGHLRRAHNIMDVCMS